MRCYTTKHFINFEQVARRLVCRGRHAIFCHGILGPKLLFSVLSLFQADGNLLVQNLFILTWDDFQHLKLEYDTGISLSIGMALSCKASVSKGWHICSIFTSISVIVYTSAQ